MTQPFVRCKSKTIADSYKLKGMLGDKGRVKGSSTRPQQRLDPKAGVDHKTFITIDTIDLNLSQLAGAKLICHSDLPQEDEKKPSNAQSSSLGIYWAFPEFLNLSLIACEFEKSNVDL